MYNWSYINSLRENYPSDDNYQNILRNPRLLYKLEKEYLDQDQREKKLFET